MTKDCPKPISDSRRTCHWF